MIINISDSLYLSDNVERKVYPDYNDTALIIKAIYIFLYIMTAMILISIDFPSPIWDFVLNLMLYYILKQYK